MACPPPRRTSGRCKHALSFLPTLPHNASIAELPTTTDGPVHVRNLSAGSR
ncbi:MAG: hypothetical protein U1E60_21870 [Reyranellaceae bacterium]